MDASKKQKFKCMMNNNKLGGGGIFFYGIQDNEKGIWVAEETTQSGNIKYNDFGGKYDYNDGDIFATIVREFREETYNTCEISYKDIKTLSSDSYIFLNGFTNEPSYLCVLCHIDTFGIKFNNELLCSSRDEILKNNPIVPKSWYNVTGVRFVPLKDLNNQNTFSFGDRLGAILKRIYVDKLNEDIQNFFLDLKRFFTS